MTKGKLQYDSKKTSFALCPTAKPSTPIIVIPSLETAQLWGTVLQETEVTFRFKKTILKEKGVMFMETCKMKK